MNEELEILSHFTDFRTLRLEQRPCLRCGKYADVQAAYFHPARKLIAFCPCGQKLELDIAFYASFVKKCKKRTALEFEPAESNYEVFNRCGFRCVYHEASRESEEFRLKQVDAIRNRFPSGQTTLIFQEPELQQMLTGGKREVEVAARNLFGLEVDHLYPRWVSLAIRRHIDPNDWALCAKHWVVAACALCNQERRHNLENGASLLYVYSRFIMPHRGNALEQANDLLAFSRVLEVVEKHGIRLQNPSGRQEDSAR